MSKRRRAFPYGFGYGQITPANVPTLALWLRGDLGVTIVPSPLVATGTAPPAVTLTGTIAAGQTQTSPGTPWIEIDITLTGVLGASQFQWKLNGVVKATGIATAATFVLGTTGLTANFPAGTYTNDNVYKANINVSAWADQSGNGNSVTQGVGTAQPVYIASGGSNGQPYLAFASANSQLLSGGGSPAAANNCTILTVAQFADIANTYKTIYNIGSSVTGIAILFQGGGNLARAVNLNAVGTDTDAAATTAWEKWTATSSTAPLQTLSVNGTAATLAVNNRVAVAAAAGHQVGSNGTPASNQMNGNISEVIVYSSVLPAASIALLETYRRRIYGL